MTIVWKWSLNWNANDSAGSNNWVSTNVTWVDWKINWAWSFNGTTSTFISPAPDYFWTQNLTFELLLYINSLPTTTSFIWFVENTIDSWIYDKGFIITNTGNISFYVYDWESKYTTISWIVAWKWYHIVWTFNWTNINITLNWVKWTPTLVSWSYNFTTPKIWIWWNWLWTYDRFNWKIDEIIIYNNYLSDAEAKNKYLYYNWFI